MVLVAMHVDLHVEVGCQGINPLDKRNGCKLWPIFAANEILGSFSVEKSGSYSVDRGDYRLAPSMPTSSSQRISFFKPRPENPCVYCSSSSYGYGCRISPTGLHYHPNDPNRCRYCGSNSHGKGCKFNPPTTLHIRGVGGTVCVYCGSSSKGKGCALNPLGIHDPFGPT